MTATSMGSASTATATLAVSSSATATATSTTGTATGDSSSSTAGTTAGAGGVTGTSESTGAGGTSSTDGSTTGTTGGGGFGVSEDVGVYDPNDPPELLDLSGDLGVHDPVVMEQDGTYYMFFTGAGSGLNTKTSTDLRTWHSGPRILSPNPGWIAGSVPGVGNLWAPDISYFGGMYHLYYSASTFGENRSCIGHATSASLANADWQDQGPVICSNVDSTGDNWNAIDPNIFVDDSGTPWMSFGSFWGGLKLIELDQTGARANDELHSIAARPSNSGALEAPFIVKRGSYYYLFMSWDSCCRGTDSTYNIRVARSESLTGPYVDQQGTPAMQGGGTLLVEGNNTYHGPGHNAILFVDKQAFNVYHAYPNSGGVLRIAELVWDAEGWPISAGP